MDSSTRAAINLYWRSLSSTRTYVIIKAVFKQFIAVTLCYNIVYLMITTHQRFRNVVQSKLMYIKPFLNNIIVMYYYLPSLDLHTPVALTQESFFSQSSLVLLNTRHGPKEPSINSPSWPFTSLSNEKKGLPTL